ncbi:hypothetical protein [Streptomyces sp. NBC_01637]|uniref:hypothetical protein n=1 Tax=unclassified Streptomyces TaxID=2593676 RepID=UPI00386CE7E9|nr:hypothetical protein OH719_00100 [Streptomyces sp. NBC_01653]WTC84613.1 hypothetical protein OH719_46770 [Streptomyces sp. NBC_01653]WTD86254.1 hypothetical protein OG891_00100 [Streptomyces sp. NBC_01637]WTD94270.1 hypothetical protein OG891_46765 [Streptomyces sp. NBC_01637]
MTDLHEPLEPLDSYPDELPPPRQRGDVNLVGLLSVADDLARNLSALKILLEKAVYLRRHAHAAMLGRCVLGADSKEGSTEGARLQLNVWDDHTCRDIVEDGTTGCVAHTVEAARRTMADPASRTRSCSPSSTTTKEPLSPAPRTRTGRHPTSSCTSASLCAPSTALSEPAATPGAPGPPPHWSVTLTWFDLEALTPPKGEVSSASATTGLAWPPCPRRGSQPQVLDFPNQFTHTASNNSEAGQRSNLAVTSGAPAISSWPASADMLPGRARAAPALIRTLRKRVAWHARFL